MIQEPVIRLTRPTDANVLSSLDLKCYPYPLTLDKWKDLANNSGKKAAPKVVVCEVLRKPCGFAVWNSEDFEVARIIRLGVVPASRKKGLGTLLLNKVKHYSQIKQIDKLQVIVPDIHCQPGDPDDVSGFLSKSLFHTTGEVIHDFRYMYGDWRDGYVFERNIVHD
jgi:hypothetical protein